MVRTFVVIVLAAGLSLPAAAAGLAWARLTADEQMVLRPLQPRWESLPDEQRARLLGAAKRYPRMSPEQQRRFSRRVTAWANLTLEQRNQARAAYRAYAQMPKAEQQRVKKGWFERHPNKELAVSDSGEGANAP